MLLLHQVCLTSHFISWHTHIYAHNKVEHKFNNSVQRTHIKSESKSNLTHFTCLTVNCNCALNRYVIRSFDSILWISAVYSSSSDPAKVGRNWTLARVSLLCTRPPAGRHFSKRDESVLRVSSLIFCECATPASLLKKKENIQIEQKGKMPKVA